MLGVPRPAAQPVDPFLGLEIFPKTRMAQHWAWGQNSRGGDVESGRGDRRPVDLGYIVLVLFKPATFLSQLTPRSPAS